MAKFDIDLARFASQVGASAGTDLLGRDTLMLAREGQLCVQWAPFDHIPRTARLVIVGITPGREQATNALRAFGQALQAGQPLEAAQRHAKLVGSFSGPMRANIVQMLDSIGVQQALGVPTCAVLFDAAHEQVHFTSALRYPVFVDGVNYNGNPPLLSTPLLRQIVETFLAEEAQLLPDALWLPLGPKPAGALRHLVELGLLPATRVLEGMPHPSGANAERIKFFLGLKPRAELSRKTRPDLIDLAREALLAQVGRLRSA
ncbi:MAG: hypothetical protein JO264_07805 [Acidisphaera sp.]|nr:hypothetical protein [Acidisphaera sp.]